MGPPDTPVSQPSEAALEALTGDDWAAILPDLRAVLQDLGDAAVPEVARLRDVPLGRLAGGRGRRELIRLLAGSGPIWGQARARLAVRDDLPAAVQQLLDPDAGAVGEDEADEVGAPDPESTTSRQRARIRVLKDDRDAWRRRAEGAEARASALEAAVAGLQGELQATREEVAEIQVRLDEASAERRRAVERERRRRDAEIAALSGELAQLRRADEERRSAERRRRERPAEAAEPTRLPDRETPPSRLVPGRPSRLPDGVAPGTREAVALLLHRGRLVLVDGYNLTRQHRADLDFDHQRAWLVQVLANLAARRRVRPVVVFDGTRASGARPPGGAREVEVRFTAEGITADDEIVLAVEGTGDPVVVVTDDRELVTRVRAGGADVVGTQAFLWVAG